MKTVKFLTKPAFLLMSLTILLMLPVIGYAQIPDKNQSDLIKPETEITDDIYWAVKAYHPQVKLLKVKAIDKDGNIHDVKAIQDSYSTSVLNVKALVDGNRLPIKLIVHGEDRYYPVKAINTDGTIMDIKAITDEGFMLDVKGVSKTGNIIHIRALDKDGAQYSVLAVSPLGEINEVQGLKMLSAPVEMVIKGVKIFAHVKAMKPD
ncbi:MAG: hypothetical protein KJO05_02020 [Bacteroidia bacterium]|nr:hypothetical protein [Bacteroidia bacterium]NNF29961.1 hypothetical protein [Flavobacteriaceae bacterium]MBT8276059.1 hypothetical protein [Bacteroidia bacterium]NNJ81213.1 hypothetical protein [Flavobacteriaceae bacterium]NNK53666.1 hypothetical protein [Flavobacteriaceae bacterium]